MLCCNCNENEANVFINRKLPDGSSSTEGYCEKCAKEKGIHPLSSGVAPVNLSEVDLKNMSEQIQDILKNMDINALVEQEGLRSEERRVGKECL